MRPIQLMLSLVYTTLLVIPQWQFMLRASVIPLSSNPATSSMTFYRSLTEGIGRVRGNLTIDLNKTAKNWRTHVTNTPDVEWILAPSALQSTGRPVMKIYFEYRDGVLQGGEGERRPHIEFQPEIVISPVPPHAQSQVIAKIYFDGEGRPIEYRDHANINVTDKMNSWDNSGWTNLAEHLRFSILPGGLFLRGPFNWTATPVQAGSSGPFLTRLYMNPTTPDVPGSGIEAELREFSNIIFTEGPAVADISDNFVVTAPSSHFELKSLNYDFSTQTLDGNITSLDFKLHSGLLTNNGLNLRLGKESRIRFDKLTFHDATNSGGNSSVRGVGGLITGDIIPGSKISFSGGASETTFSTDSDSTLTLEDVRLDVIDQSSVIAVGNGSRLNLHLSGGRLPLVNTDYLLIKNGILSARFINGTWQKGAVPSVSVNIDLLNCEINSGVFSMRPNIGINLRGGAIKANDLKFDSAAAPSLTGSFSDVIFDVEDGTTLELPNRFLAVCRSGTRLVANNPVAPFSITPGKLTAVASFRAVIPFWTCYTPPNGSPVIRDSMLRSSIVLVGNGTILGTDEIVDYTCCAR